MMVSPMGYIRDFENSSFEELIQERKRLERNIASLEKIVYDKDKTDEAWRIHPRPDVRYQTYLEYMSELCLLLREKYNKEIVWGQSATSDSQLAADDSRKNGGLRYLEIPGFLKKDEDMK